MLKITIIINIELLKLGFYLKLQCKYEFTTS